MIVVRRYLLVRLYLGWHAFVAVVIGVELIVLPTRLVAGPSTVALYTALAPPVWGVLFVGLAAAAAAGCRWPLHAWRPAIFALGLAQIAWALGLLAPLLTGNARTNLLAPTAWVALAVTSGIVAVETIREESCPDVGRRG